MFPRSLIGFAPRVAISTISSFGTLPLGTVASAAWPTANKVLYAPIRVPDALWVRQLFVSPGAAVSGNIDVGLYSLDGTKLVASGSTAQAGATTTLQVFNVTDTLIGPGAYFLGVTLDNMAIAIAYLTAAELPLTGCGCDLRDNYGFVSMAQKYYGEVRVNPLSGAEHWMVKYGDMHGQMVYAQRLAKAHRHERLRML